MSATKTVTSLACLACREKHLRCDADRPRCRRCRVQGIGCVYTTSKRGQRPARRRPTLSVLNSSPVVLSTEPSSRDRQSGGSIEQQPSIDSSTTAVSPEQSELPRSTTSSLVNDPLLRVYYRSFHPAHPFLPPWCSVSISPTLLPDYLFEIMRFVASHYMKTKNLSSPTEEECRLLLDSSRTESAAYVQACLLLTIGLHARNRQAEAVMILSRAREAAVRLSLYDERQVGRLAGDSLLLQESFRRTWWELLTIDAILSALHKRTSVELSTMPVTVHLPCENAAYDAGCPPSSTSPLTLVDLTNRFFEATPQVYPSSALRIEATLMLCRALTIDQDPVCVCTERFEEVNMMLSCWTHHLPDAKREILVGSSGRVDEALFQAHMIVNTAIILIHLPRSSLQEAHEMQSHIECAVKPAVRASFASAHVHSVSAARAAERLSQMASLPVADITNHTPFWACALVISTSVHLSVCGVTTAAATAACECDGDCLRPHRHRIIQTLGLLTTLGAVWPIASHAMTQVRGVANDVIKAGWRPGFEGTRQQQAPQQPLGDVGFFFDGGSSGGGARLLQEHIWNADLADLFDCPAVPGLGGDDTTGAIHF